MIEDFSNPQDDIVDSMTPKETPEVKAQRLAQEVVRLRFDVVNTEVPNPNFNSDSGEDLRNNPLRKAEVVHDTMTRRAAGDLQSALGIRDVARYSQHTGREIPPVVMDEKGKPTTDSLTKRIGVFRQEVSDVVAKAKAKGVQIPRFDSQTREQIPEDSLRALNEARRVESSRQMTEAEQDAADINMGIDALRRMKQIKTDDAIRRAQAGLPPER